MSITKKIGLSITGIVGLAVLIYAGENLRGKAAWEKFKKDWEAKGEVFDYKQVIPKPVPTEKNFAHTPMLKALFDPKPEQNLNEPKPGKKKNPSRAEGLMVLEGKQPELAQWSTGRSTDLKAWQKYFREQKDWPHPEKAGRPADDILIAMKKHKAEFAELAKAAKDRPLCRFDVKYEAHFAALLPHLSVLRNAARGYTLRALAHLAKDNPDAAFADVRMAMVLANSIKDEPILISHLVRIALLDLSMQPVWEGLAGNQWKAAHLGALERLLAGIDLIRAQSRAMLGERDMANLLIDEMHDQTPAEWAKLLGDGQEIFPALTIAPKGWVYQNQVNFNRVHLEFSRHITAAKARRIKPEMAVAMEKHVNKMGRGPYHVLPNLLLPGIGRLSIRTGSGQAAVDHARIACLLELHKRKHGSYPVALAKLESGTPHDPYTGKPYAYATAKGRYRLHGVGWNQKDEGGKMVFTNAKGSRDWEKGDLTWQYTPMKLPKK